MRNKRGTLPLKILTVRIAVKLEIRLQRNNFIFDRNLLPLKFVCSWWGTAIKNWLKNRTWSMWICSSVNVVRFLEEKREGYDFVLILDVPLMPACLFVAFTFLISAFCFGSRSHSCRHLLMIHNHPRSPAGFSSALQVTCCWCGWWWGGYWRRI